MMMGQDYVGDSTAGEFFNIGSDTGRLIQRGAAVDEQDPGPATHHADGHIEEGQPAPPDAGGQRLPLVVHRSTIPILWPRPG